MTQQAHRPDFPSNRLWAGPANLQNMPIDIPNGPRAGSMAHVLATRLRSGETIVEVTWPIKGEANLASHKFTYDTPKAALEAGWELGAIYVEDAKFMERMVTIYRATRKSD